MTSPGLGGTPFSDAFSRIDLAQLADTESQMFILPSTQVVFARLIQAGDQLQRLGSRGETVLIATQETWEGTKTFPVTDMASRGLYAVGRRLRTNVEPDLSALELIFRPSRHGDGRIVKLKTGRLLFSTATIADCLWVSPVNAVTRENTANL